MLKSFTEHEKAMQWLIAYLYVFVTYGFISSCISLVEFLDTIRAFSPDISSSSEAPEAPGFTDEIYSTGDNENPVWAVIFSMAPLFVITFVLGIAAASGLLYRKAWGWWLAGIYFTWAIIIAIPSILTYVFVVIPAAGQSGSLPNSGALDSGALAWYLLHNVIALLALWYLFSPKVRTLYHVSHHGVTSRIFRLIGGAIVVYVLTAVPWLIKELVTNVG